MTALVVFWIVANLLSVAVLTYAVRDALKDYRLATRTNGWRKLAARGMLRSQSVRLAEVVLLLSTAVLAAIWPTAPRLVETRPVWVLITMRTTLTAVVVLITLSAVLDVLDKRRIIRRPGG